MYQVHASWDPKAEVWVATSKDVPGLATEAPTYEALTEKLRDLIPELLGANRMLHGEPANVVSFELIVDRSEKALREAAWERIQGLLEQPPVVLGHPRPDRDELHQR